jgi:hypothetical protein
MQPGTEKCLIADGDRNIGELESEVRRKNYICLAVSIKSQFEVPIHASQHEVMSIEPQLV